MDFFKYIKKSNKKKGSKNRIYVDVNVFSLSKLTILKADISKTSSERYRFLFIFVCRTSKYTRMQKIKDFYREVNYVHLALNRHSCIEIYAHSCLKPFSIGRKPCSNSKTHVQIMKFTCRLNMGFGRRHWSMRRDVMCFVLNKMADVEEAPRVSVSFYVVNVMFKRFLSGLERKCKNNDQPWFVSVFKHSLDHSEGV